MSKYVQMSILKGNFLRLARLKVMSGALWWSIDVLRGGLTSLACA